MTLRETLCLWSAEKGLNVGFVTDRSFKGLKCWAELRGCENFTVEGEINEPRVSVVGGHSVVHSGADGSVSFPFCWRCSYVMRDHFNKVLSD